MASTRSIAGAPSRAMTIELSPDDYAELAALRPEVRDDVRRWIAALGKVVPPIGASLASLASAMGVSPRTARRKWDSAAMHGWRGLVDRAMEPSLRTGGIAPETIEHFRKLVALNQRKTLPAYRLLVRQFLSGEPIPGVAPDVSRKCLPPGWSRTNLVRHAPTKFEITALRIGRSAARSLGPLVYTTRRELWVGSHYLFDDMVHDHFVNVLDSKKTGRPLEFHGLDLFSACKFAWGMRVRTENEITGRMEGLREENMRSLLAVVFSRDGYHAERGTELVVEHGTAAVREDLERLLFDLSRGKITVRRSGIEGDPAHVGQYAGRSKGNFRFKAALESLGNLIHNEMGFLAAQTGLSVDRRPEEIHGLLRHNDALLDAFAALAVDRPQLAAALRFPVLSDRQFHEIAMEVYRRINSRTDHNLEGWDLMVRPDERDLTRVRRMSPMEVWMAGRGQLTRLRAEHVALMLYRDCAVERTVAGGEITLRDSDIGSDEFRFDASSYRDGEKYQVVCNSFDPDRAYLFDARRRFVGAIPRRIRVSRADDEAVRREMGHVNKVLAERLAPVAALGREIAQQRIADARHNAEVLAQAEATRSATPSARAARAGSRLSDGAEHLVPAAESESAEVVEMISQHALPGADVGEVEDLG